MSEEEQKMIWTIGLNDHISGGLDNIISKAENLRRSLSGAFKGLTEPADVVDAALEMVGKRLQEIGKSEKDASSALKYLEAGFEKFTDKSASAKDVLTEWGKAFREANISGKDFVQVMAPLAAALDKLYQPTSKAVEVMDELYKRLDDMGVPVNLYKDELEKLEKQVDNFVRSGEGANELLENSAQLFQQMGASGRELDALTASIQNLTEAEKREAEAAQAAADAEAAHRAAIEEAKRASDEDVKNNFLKLSKAHKEGAIQSTLLSVAFVRLLNKMGMLPKGVSHLVTNFLSLERGLSSVAKHSKALSGLTEMLTVRIGYAGKQVNVFTYAVAKMAQGVKGFLTACHGAGAAAAAVLAVFVIAYKKFEKDLVSAREAVAKTFDETLRLAERRGNIIADIFNREAKAADDATKRIRDEAHAYEELAKAKENVAKAKSEDALAGIEADRKKWKRENGDATPEETAIADALFDYQAEQQKQQDLKRQQSYEIGLSNNEDKRRRRERELARTRYDETLQSEQDAVAAYDALESSKPDRSDIKTANVPEALQNFRYKDEGEYEEAMKKWREQRKAAKELVETTRAARTDAENALPEFNENVRKDDEAYTLNKEADAIRRATAARNQDEAVTARGDAYNRALYAYETNEQRKADAQTLKMDKLSRASTSATRVRKEAEQKLAGSTDETEQVALQYAVKEKKIDEDLAQTREKLERERYQLISQTNDKLEQERINAEYDYSKMIAEAIAEREREELASAKAVHSQRVADAQKEYNERMAQLQEEQSAAQSRVQAAQSQVAKAWGWYRNKDTMAAYRDEQDADMAAQEQYQKDYHSLTHGRRAGQFAEAKELQRLGHTDKLEERMGEWRKKKMLSVDEEATMRVALAKDEEKNAIEYARQTAEDMKRAADSLEAIKATFEEGGE